jgi:hypothetical protein
VRRGPARRCLVGGTSSVVHWSLCMHPRATSRVTSALSVLARVSSACLRRAHHLGAPSTGRSDILSPKGERRNPNDRLHRMST